MQWIALGLSLPKSQPYELCALNSNVLCFLQAYRGTYVCSETSLQSPFTPIVTVILK